MFWTIVGALLFVFVVIPIVFYVGAGFLTLIVEIFTNNPTKYETPEERANRIAQEQEEERVRMEQERESRKKQTPWVILIFVLIFLLPFLLAIFTTIFQ